jgi:phage-related tail fiber protein
VAKSPEEVAAACIHSTRGMHMAVGDTDTLRDAIAAAIRAAVEAEREALLTRLYQSDQPAYLAVAELCDGELDRSGGLLGRIRADEGT